LRWESIYSITFIGHVKHDFPWFFFFCLEKKEWGNEYGIIILYRNLPTKS
jgi:hypothetical protein